MANLTIDVPPFVVYVSKVTESAKDQPKYGNWFFENRLRCVDIFGGSSIAGQSYAKIQLITGEDGTGNKTVDIEESSTILWHGDRVAIGLQRTPKQIDWKFCGYCLSANMSIDIEAERRIYKIVGPEWIWGGSNTGAGTIKTVAGQAHRLYAADDAWQKKPATVSKFADWEIFSNEKAVFNIGGKANCARDDVILTSPQSKMAQVKGKIWESPNRRIKSVDVATVWDMRNACKTIVTVFGELVFSGIEAPEWTEVPMLLADKMRETNVEGVGVWEALKRICGAKYFFMVEPFPTDKDGEATTVSGKSWGPFKLKFFDRTKGTEANLVLNRKGTQMSQAQASVKRLESVRDISGTVNKVVVRGTFIRSLRLYYFGGATPGMPMKNRKIAFQNGWGTNDEDIADYAVGAAKEVTPIYHPDAGSRTRWLTRYVTSGAQFPQYWNVFRRFTWNEAGEEDTLRSAKYAGFNLNYYAPDLDDIADNPDKPKKWYRHRRKPIDTFYLRSPQVNSWEKHPPTLYMAAATSKDDANVGNWKWHRISESHFKLDSDRASFTITVEDIGEWKPFYKHDSEEGGAQAWPDDERSFGTLLASGVLRMCLECSIVCDGSLEGTAERKAGTASPFVREIVIPAADNFIVCTAYSDGFNSPSGQASLVLDQRADAVQYAKTTQSSSDDEQIHASVITSGDWAFQSIGSLISTIKGRNINLKSAGGHGAQIVAYRIDPTSLHYEYLTETVALALLARERKLQGKAQIFDAKRASTIPNG